MNIDFNRLKDQTVSALQAAAKTTAEVTKKLADNTKRSISLMSEEEKLKKAYQELGQRCFERIQNGETVDEASCQQLAQLIIAYRKNIEMLRKACEQQDAQAEAAQEQQGAENFEEEPKTAAEPAEQTEGAEETIEPQDENK